MADSASSSSSVASSKCSSDTEVITKPKRAKISKHGKVSKSCKHKMKLRSSKWKHYHKKQRRQHQSSSDSEHTHKKSNRRKRDLQMRKRTHSPLPSSGTSRESEGNYDDSMDTDSVSSNESSSEQDRKAAKHSKPSVKNKKKKAKLYTTGSKASSRNDHLKEVFRKHFAELMVVVSNPEQLAAQLYSKSLISRATLGEVITVPTSQQKKLLTLLWDLDGKIQTCPEKLFDFIHMIKEDSSLEKVAEQVLGMSIF